MESIFLSKTELEQLTHRKQRSSQSEALNALGIIHKVRLDGSPIVLRSHLIKEMGGNTTLPHIAKPMEPDWSELQ